MARQAQLPGLHGQGLAAVRPEPYEVGTHHHHDPDAREGLLGVGLQVESEAKGHHQKPHQHQDACEQQQIVDAAQQALDERDLRSGTQRKGRSVNDWRSRFRPPGAHRMWGARAQGGPLGLPHARLAHPHRGSRLPQYSSSAA